ncbi:MAG: hypothetical protein NTZ34_05880 [Chloroflexi bacterium]|nr:hypothetical protein [Chloroflexota bacterium]
MVFGSLFKPKGKLVLQAKDNSLPGELLPIEIRFTPEKEIKPREVRGELVGEETYYVTVTTSDDDMRDARKDEKFASIIQTVAEQPSLLPGVEQKWSSSIQLPADAPPTCHGKLVNIRWTLKAVLDVPKSANLSQEKPLNVVCPSPQVSDHPALPAENIYKEVTLTLKAPQVASIGSTLKGQLTLQIKDKLSFRSIKVELVRVEEAGSRKANEVISTTQISGEASFNQNESPSFEFSLDIPAEAPPTVICKRSNLRWKVRAVIDRKMKSDFNVEQELLVYNASKA